MSTRLKGKELEYFNICNLGIKVKKNKVSLEDSVCEKIMNDKEFKEYAERWIAYKLFEKGAKYDIIEEKE